MGVCWAHVGSMLGRVGPILGPCLAYVAPMFASIGHVGPMLGLCWAHLVRPMLGLCWAYVGPMLSPNLATYPILGLFKPLGKPQDSTAIKAPPKLNLNSYFNCFRLMHANKKRLVTFGAGGFDQRFCSNDGGGDFHIAFSQFVQV